ncbi:hypothetical protein BDV18DRAFT_153640 [Aspergillus unguis]
MARRRLSAGLPPNFRYPLITPDNERESFIDHDFHGDGSVHSADPFIYSAHQPRDNSPAPQIVRVAKQPEMIRRQSLRPHSGDWVTPDSLSGSKVPGSFHDADAEDMGPEIIDAAPRSRAEVVDLYSDESDENLDFGSEEPLAFPQLPLEEVVLEVAYILRARSNPPSEGFAYIFADITGRSKFYRVGSARNIPRQNEHRNACSISYFRIQKKPSTPIWQYKRLEKLAEAELVNMSYEPNCTCNVKQRQFLWGREQTAAEILDSWSSWLVGQSPYDRTGHLLPFWEHRLRLFEENIDKYFDCKGSRCMKRTTDSVACPICLRAGWKAFVMPSGLDKIEFASRTQAAAQWAHRVLLYLQNYIPISDKLLVPLVNGIEQASSMSAAMSDRFKSPVLLLNLLYARVIIPMLWSTIFTTAAYFSVLSILEIVFFSIIYLFVRLELAHISVHRYGTDKYNKEGRIVRRKPLPSTSDIVEIESNRGKPTSDPSVIDILDDRASNSTKPAKPSSKTSGKKLKPASLLFPGEAAARLKRTKPGRRKTDFLRTLNLYYVPTALDAMYPSPNSGGRSDVEEAPQTKRTARACDACYKRKIKCDAAVPRCNWCSHHDSPCTFERKVRRTRKRLGGAKESEAAPGSQLSERIARIERLLSEKLSQDPGSSLPQQIQSITSGFDFKAAPSPLAPSPLAASPPVIPQTSASSSVPLHFAGRELGTLSLFTGIPFILPEGQEWVQSRTGQKLAFDQFTPNRAPWEKQRGQNSNAMLIRLHASNSLDLPDRRLLEANFEAYTSSLMQRVFPVVDPVLFRKTINSAYKDSFAGHDGAQVSSKACMLTFAAFVSMLCNPCLTGGLGRKMPEFDEEASIVKARYVLCQALQEPPNIDALQAVIMMAYLELFTGNLQSANYYGSIAARMIFMLGGHIFTDQRSWFPPSADLESRRRGHIRNLFWLCYTGEQDIALRTGQAQLFSEDNCDLTLPPDYVEQYYATLEYHHNDTNLPPNPIFPMDLRLSIIKARAYSALYSFRALKKTDAEILKDIRELDDELERWRLSFPPQWRPTLSFKQEKPDPNCNMHSVILRLNYHLCMTIIHQASSRCKSWANQGCVMDGVSSSLALSVEASRSTLLYLETAGDVLVDGVFWALIFYPISALLAIFCNILQNPAEPQASKDLALLKSATGMLERVFLKQSYSVNELVHVRLITDFVGELCRLATCAMDKAWRESSGGDGGGGTRTPTACHG